MTGGFLVSVFMKLFGQVDLVHVRSYVPFSMALPWLMFSRTPCLFHTEGFWFDEKVDFGSWPQNGYLFKVGKQLEKVLYRRADAISVLTYSAKQYLELEYENRKSIVAPIFVVTVCTDLKRFCPPSMETAVSMGDLIYVGSLGGWYMADEMVRFYSAWRKLAPSSRFIVVTKSPVDQIRRALLDICAEDELVHKIAEHDEVPTLIQQAQAAVCFIRPTFSKRGSMPTKLGEYLACGVPVAANIIGDMAQVLHASSAGVVLHDFSDSSIEWAAKELFRRSLDGEVRADARALAEKWFNLDDAVDVYDRIYQSLCVV